MRIIHLSDIHLSAGNIEHLKDYYLKKLIVELKKINQVKLIDLIIITGDLVDKGGSSLKNIKDYKGQKEITPFQIFEIEFIDPICNAINLSKGKIIFIPGNHDIDRDGIDEITEAGLISLLKDPEAGDKYYKKLKELNELSDSNKRLKGFKEFEKRYAEEHYNQSKYSFSYFESVYVVKCEIDNKEIGLALINDSWRCSNELKEDNHYIGYSQFIKCLNFLEKNKSEFNIAVMHHPLDSICRNEKNRIKSILIHENYDIVMAGHYHTKYAERLNEIGTDKGCIYIQGRTAFDSPNEKIESFQPGFNVIDISFDPIDIQILNMKYRKDNYDFIGEIDPKSDLQKKAAIPEMSLDIKKFFLPYDDEQ